jgi:bifunctional glutamyl/prolyl-tRNA synthetase
MADDLKSLQDQQAAQGEKVRKLKADKADKASIDVEVKKLLDLKEQVTKKATALGVQVEAPKIDSKKPIEKSNNNASSSKDTKKQGLIIIWDYY